MSNLNYTFILLLLTAILAISVDCSNQHVHDTQKKQLVTSFYPVEIIVLNLVKDVPGINISMLTPPGTGCLHNYQLTPVDMGKIEKADCLVINGAGMESFLDKIIHENNRFTLINASSKCDLLHNEKDVDHDSDNEHHHSDVNPHVWLSPTQYLIQIQTIADGFAHWDSLHAGLYRQNMEVYTSKIKQLQSELDTLLKDLPDRDFITFHTAFSYFAREYHFNIRTVIEQEPGQEPSAAELVELIRIIRQYNIRTVFVEPQYHSKTADVISRETGVHVDTLDPVVTGAIEPDAYIKAMRKNGSVLNNALKREVPGNGN